MPQDRTSRIVYNVTAYIHRLYFQVSATLPLAATAISMEPQHQLDSAELSSGSKGVLLVAGKSRDLPLGNSTRSAACNVQTMIVAICDTSHRFTPSAGTSLLIVGAIGLLVVYRMVTFVIRLLPSG